MKYFDSKLIINLNSIKQNYKNLTNILDKNIDCAAVVKSNAYSLGVKPVVNALSAVGCNKFYVANLNEAIEVRECSITDEVLVLNGIMDGEEEEFLFHNLTPVLNNAYQLDIWRNFSRRKGIRLSCVIHIDTGMNRLGFDYDEFIEYIKENGQFIDDLEIVHFMSHLACAEIKDHPLNKLQLELSQNIQKLFPNHRFSLSNSAGIFIDPKYHFNIVRPGALLYGLNVTSQELSFIKPVIKMTSRILQIREIRKATTVGYRATKNIYPGMKLAIIALGYSDGVLLSLSNKGHCYIGEHKASIVGRVSMDSVTVDVTNIPEFELYPGAEVEIIGPNSTIEEMAKNSGTIPYEILLSFGHRFKIIYEN